MKAKHTILLIALGFTLDFFGTLLRITHGGYAGTIIVIATICKALGVLLLAYKVINYEGFRKFMER